MKKLLKYLVIVLVWLVIAAVVIGGALALGGTIGAGLTVLAVLFGAWLAFLLGRKLIRRHRARKRAENLVNVEPAPAVSRGAGTRGWFDRLRRAPRTPLERRFRSLARLLARSRLREKGDPLYVLPWYLLLGHDGSGKTDLVSNAGLSLPTLDDPALRGTGDSLDWWLYNEAIVLDTPGAYVGADEEAPRHPDWPALLRILSEGRSREPLNGIVVAVSYERLEGDADDLFDYGRMLRKRIDDLMRSTRLHLPVYVVVTKCDQMSGFAAWCGNLDRDTLRQPMGMLNPRAGGDGDTARPFIREAISGISDRVSRLMLVLFNERRPDPDLLRLPRVLEGLTGPLSTFADGLFQATTFEEAPRFQGLYLTGRESEGEHAQQAFARELFSRVLPAHRGVHSTLSRAERAERDARRFALSGWGVAVIAALAVMVGAWVSHKGYLSATAEQYAGQFGHAESLTERIDRMHRLHTMINEVAAETSAWLMPWFGLPGAAEPAFVEELRQIYYERSQREVLGPLDGRFDRAVSDARGRAAGGELPDDELAFLISSLIERINVLAAYADGTRGAALQDYPGPYDDSGLYFDQAVDPLTIERANGVYAHALMWSPDPALPRRVLSHRREQLVALLQTSGERMSWLVPWANDRLPASGLRLTDFWTGTGQVSDAPVIAPAFTVAGFDAIDLFLEELAASGIAAERFAELESGFRAWYRERYLDAWERFARDFDRGTELLNGRDEWQQAVNSLATERSPHFLLLEVMYENLAPFERDALPDWAKLVRFHDEMRSFAPNQVEEDNTARNRVFTKLGLGLIKRTGPVGKTIAKSGKRSLKTKKRLDRADARSGTTPDERALRLEEAGQILGDYRGLLGDIAFNSDIRSVSHEATAAFFRDPDNPGKGEGPKAQAHQKMRELQQIAGIVTQYNEPFWEVFAGPLDVVGNYYVQESACYVQEMWEKEFLTSLAGVPDSRLPQYVFGEGQQLWQFLSQNLDPFVERRLGAGYVPVNAGGQFVPLREDFLTFATEGRQRSAADSETYTVRIEAEPTSANRDAVYKPGRTFVQLRCQAGDQDIVNYNYPASAVFNWDPQCNDTVLEIDVGRHTLVRQWTGREGFARFLREFRTGTQRYGPEDFPRFQNTLEDYRVEYIAVGFRFSGHEPLIRMLERAPAQPPRRIASCWD